MTDDLGFRLLLAAYHFGLMVVVGGGLALGVFAAPAIFRSARSRAEAGEIFGAVLARYDGVAIMAVLLVWATAYLRAVNYDAPIGPAHVARWIALGLMGIATIYASGWSNPVARSLRKQVPGFADLPVEHPLKREFAALHARSTRAMSVAMLLGVVALVLS